jgi:acetyl esterase
VTNPKPVVLEEAARAFAEETSKAPFIYQLPINQGRQALEDLQAGNELKPDAKSQDVVIDTGTNGHIGVRIVQPPRSSGLLPVVLYIHGAGWVFGSPDTHDRLVRELSVGANVAVVVPHYDRSPEAKYPKALEQCWSTAQWVLENGADYGIDPGQMMIAGDSCGGNLAAAMTLMAKDRAGQVAFKAQLLFYPVTNANFDSGSYLQFAEGYYLRREGMQWFFDQYTNDRWELDEPTVSPFRAPLEQLQGLPPAMVLNGEADVLRDEGEGYADHLRAAGVPVTAMRFAGMIHDFVMLDALRGTHAAKAAITAAIGFIRESFATD